MFVMVFLTPEPGDRSRRKEGKEKKDARDPKSLVEQGCFIHGAACAYILSYKEALGRKIKLSKKHRNQTLNNSN